MSRVLIYTSRHGSCGILANISRSPAKNPLFPLPPLWWTSHQRRFMGEFHSSSFIRAPSPAILHHFAISFSWENDDRGARFLRRPPPRDINYHGGQGDERRENQGVNGRDTWRGNDRFVAMTQRLPRGGWGGGELNIHGCQKNVALLFHKRNPMPGNHYSRTILATSNPFPLKIGCSNVARRRRTISPPLSLLRVDVSEIRAPSLPLPPILLSNFRDGNHDAFPCTRQGK